MKPHICVVIPAWNEEKSISKVVCKIMHLQSKITCLVVDDGSNDLTAIVAQDSGAKVISMGNNFGTGMATERGLKEAIKKRSDITILMDADGQHDPKYIQALIKRIQSGADCVIASRYVKKTDNVTSWMRRLGTWFISIMVQIKYDKKITDPTSGFRAYNRRAAELLASQYPTTFSEPETIMILLDNGYSIVEISSQMNPRRHGKSSISTIRAVQLMWQITRKLIFRSNSVDC